VHDIRLRLAIDETMTDPRGGSHDGGDALSDLHRGQPILQRLVGESIGKGWREVVRRKIGRLEGCTHLSELLGPAVTTLFQTMSPWR
jgi:hypothetical protein